MCGISGFIHIQGQPVSTGQNDLQVMNHLLVHRGPDDSGTWTNDRGNVGFAHRRLSIIDLSPEGRQPLHGPNDTHLAFNGEIYNYVELKEELKSGWTFRTKTDTETILAGYERYGRDVVNHLRGMFAIALWDEKNQVFMAARDQFGIKPFYYSVVNNVLYFASEIKALLPFVPDIETDMGALNEYLTFQFTIGQQTMFKGIQQLMPGHMLTIQNGQMKVERYWDVHFNIDHDHSAHYFQNRLKELVNDSVKIHLRSDVPVGSYLSGGVDSSLIAIMASRFDAANKDAFHGKFTEYQGYDESHYAQAAADKAGKNLHQIDMTANDFLNSIDKVMYHLDHPVAGPGSFPQYMVSQLASRHVKVVLGGQGGDEIFGGYARYLVAYLEQCIKASIEGTYQNGNFVVTPESIIPNLQVLKEYKPMIRTFWKDGLFDSLDKRYYRLVDRSADVTDEIRWEALDRGAVFDSYQKIFNNASNVGKASYFDSMTHFDFKTLLPALLQVEDRMSMAHGLESRVPFLDKPLIEFAATIPADVKFKDGQLKLMLRQVFSDVLPDAILNRKDKMGFPYPLSEWMQGPLKPMLNDLFTSTSAMNRSYLNSQAVLKTIENPGRYSRKIWGLLSLELWHKIFHDRAADFRKLRETVPANAPQRAIA